MLNYIKYFISFLFLLSIYNSYGQSRKIVQFSGIIISTKQEFPVAYVTIQNKSFNLQTAISNQDGYFSFVAHEGDTIHFSSVGFESLEYVIPQVSEDRHTAQIKMNSLIIELPAVTPFPWSSYEQYVADFMAMKPGEDALSAARRNLSPEALAALARIVPRNADEIQSASSLQRHINMSNRNVNQRFNNPLLNPFAWAQFINQIKRGDYSREKLKY